MRICLPGGVHKLLYYTQIGNSDILVYLSASDLLFLCNDKLILRLNAYNPEVRVSGDLESILVVFKGEAQIYKLFEQFSGEVIVKQWRNERLDADVYDACLVNGSIVYTTTNGTLVCDAQTYNLKTQIGYKIRNLGESALLYIGNCVLVFNYKTHEFSTIEFDLEVENASVLTNVFALYANNTAFVYTSADLSLSFVINDGCLAMNNGALLARSGNSWFSLDKNGAEVNATSLINGEVNFCGVSSGYGYINDNLYYFRDTKRTLITGITKQNLVSKYANFDGSWIWGNHWFNQDFESVVIVPEYEHALLTSNFLALVTKDNNLMVYKQFKLVKKPIPIDAGVISLQIIDDCLACVYPSHMLVYKPDDKCEEVKFNYKITSLYGENALLKTSKCSIYNYKSQTCLEIPDVKGEVLYMDDKFIISSTKEQTTVLEYLRKHTVVMGASIAAKWSKTHKFLALLGTNNLEVYVRTTNCRGLLVLVHKEFAHKCTMIAWKDYRLLLSDGKQIFEVEFDGHQLHAALNSLSIVSNAPSITDVYTLANSKLPIYHTSVLAMFLIAQIPHAVLNILDALLSNIKFCNHHEGDIAILPYDLGLTDTQIVEKSAVYDVNAELQQYLSKCRPQGLPPHGIENIKRLIEILRNSYTVLDPLALAALYIQPNYPHESAICAYLSSTKLELKDRMPNTSHYWLNRTDLSSELEQEAKIVFARSRDPTLVTLHYLALRKKEAILTLWRVSSSFEKEKTLKLLKNDFSSERWRTAALKNAYALLSKHRTHYAAAFFLLGDSIVDCCQILVNKLNDLNLAIVIARVYDGDSGAGMQYLAGKCMCVSPTLQAFGYLVSQQHDKAKKVLRESAKTGRNYDGILLSALFGESLLPPDLNTYDRFYKMVSLNICSAELPPPEVPDFPPPNSSTQATSNQAVSQADKSHPLTPSTSTPSTSTPSTSTPSTSTPSTSTPSTSTPSTSTQNPLPTPTPNPTPTPQSAPNALSSWLDESEPQQTTTTNPPEDTDTDTDTNTNSNPTNSNKDYEFKPDPAKFKPAPTDLQLEPDMSAFGF